MFFVSHFNSVVQTIDEIFLFATIQIMEKIAVLFCLVTALHAFPLGGNLNGIADYSFDIGIVVPI